MESVDRISNKVADIYGRAIWYSDKKIWCDSSNKISWLIPFVDFVFQEKAKFIHIVRDGRKTVSSFVNKLGNEHYNQKDVTKVIKWLACVYGRKPCPFPPYEKKYWWPLPNSRDDYKGDYDQFSLSCWHWQKINDVIIQDTKNFSSDKLITCKFNSFGI